eukprot:PhM_4_TR19022/c0_g1_i1/m.63492
MFRENSLFRRCQRTKRLFLLCLVLALVGFLAMWAYVSVVGPSEAPSDKLFKALVCIDKVLQKNHFTYWLDAGALLGSVREKKLIPWDPDVDLGFLASDMDLLIHHLPEIDLTCGTHSFHRNTRNFWSMIPLSNYLQVSRTAVRILTSPYSMYYVEFADFEDMGAGRLSDRHAPESYSPEYPQETILPISRKCVLSGLMFPCPNNSEYVLEKQFGRNWRVPKKGCFASHPESSDCGIEKTPATTSAVTK